MMITAFPDILLYHLPIVLSFSGYFTQGLFLLLLELPVSYRLLAFAVLIRTILFKDLTYHYSSLLILASSLSFSLRIDLLPNLIALFWGRALPPPLSAPHLSSNALLRVLLCWLVPSLLFRCFICVTSLHSQLFFMPLTLALGCFPLDLRPSRSKSVCNRLSLFIPGFFSYWIYYCRTLLNFINYALPLQLSQITSYLQVRLAFHRYVQVFPDSCYNHEFVPPTHFTLLSNCSYIDHLVSGPMSSNYFLFLFAFACYHTSLASPLYKRYPRLYLVLRSNSFPGLFHFSLAILFHLSLTLLISLSVFSSIQSQWFGSTYFQHSLTLNSDWGGLFSPYRSRLPSLILVIYLPHPSRLCLMISHIDSEL